MSYMRAGIYLWEDDTHLHIWAAEGQHGWNDSIWTENQQSASARGVGIPREIVDDFVVMRLAELLASGKLPEIIDRAVSRYHGNGGCMALETRALDLKRVLGAVK